MDELRRSNFVKIVIATGETVEGEVVDYSDDRALIAIAETSLSLAQNIKELDEVKVFVYTHLGLKEMRSAVIEPLNSLNCLVVENTPTVKVEQKRAFVRVASDLKFKLSKDNLFYDCKCMNISAGGVAFWLRNSKIEIGDLVTIAFPKEEFEKDILTQATIIKKDTDWFVAKYIDLNPRDEDKIVKYVFKTIVKY